MDKYHVTPVDDLVSHQESENCACNPRIEIVGENVLVIHNSYDRRELIEEANKAMEDENGI